MVNNDNNNEPHQTDNVPETRQGLSDSLSEEKLTAEIALAKLRNKKTVLEQQLDAMNAAGDFSSEHDKADVQCDLDWCNDSIKRLEDEA